MSVEYAKVRVQFGRPIGSFQAIKHKCADMLLEVESGKSAAYYASWAAAEDNDELPVVAALSKAYCSEAYFHADRREHPDPRWHRLHVGAPRAPLLQAREELRDLPRRPDVPPRAARTAHRHLTHIPARSHTLLACALADFTVASFNAHWGVGRFGDVRRRALRRRRGRARLRRRPRRGARVVARARRPRRCSTTLRDDGYRVETHRVHATRSTQRTRSADRDTVPGDGAWELAVCSRFPVLARRTYPDGHGAHAIRRARGHALALHGRRRRCRRSTSSACTRRRRSGASRRCSTCARCATAAPADRTAESLAGDFNFWGPGVVRGAARLAAAPCGAGPIPRTARTARSITCSCEATSTVLSGEVLAETPSDHRPIRARLRLVKPGANPDSRGAVG